MSPSKKTTVSLVVPCFNEAEVIGLFHAELARVVDSIDEYDFQICYVDDGSQDGTLGKLATLAARDQRVQVLALSRNFGHQTALMAGLENVNGDAVITLDSDLQHPPSFIPQILKAWNEGFDIVSMVRETTDGASFFKRTSSAWFYKLLNAISDTKVVPGASDFMLLSRQAKEALTALPDRHLFIRGMVSWIGFPRTFIHYNAPPRAAGKSKYGLAKMISLSLNGIFSLSIKPITLAIRFGTAIIVMSGAYFAYIAGRYILFGDLVPGWASIATLVMFFSGVHLCFIGLIGQYLGRVFEQVKNRPRYYLKDLPNFQMQSQTKGKAA